VSRRLDARRRRRRRDSAVIARVIAPIDPRVVRSVRGQRPRSWLAALAASGSALAHVALLIPAWGSAAAPPPPRRVEIAVTRVAPEPAPEPAAEPEPAPESAPAPAPAPAPESAPAPAPAPAPAEPATPPPPVVGISLESTVSAGPGPAFAAGNTRAGATERQARDPGDIPTAPPAPPAPEPAPANRAATRIPGGGAASAELVKPERLRELEPEYPEALKAQGIEDSVTVAVKLDASGRVAGVEIVAPAAHEPFNRAALATARRERFRPARRGGRAIDYTLTFTYRFRLSDA
jgi:protein TonB